MRNSSNIMILVLAILMGGLAAFLTREWLTSRIDSADASEQPGTVVVATGNLGFGTPLSADNLTEIVWPSKIVPDGAFAHVQDIIKDGRRVVLTPLVKNEPVVATKITEPGQRGTLSTMIGEGKRAVTVPVDDVRGVAGFVFPGDYVDVALTRTDGGANGQNYSEVILQHVKVLAIDQTTGDRQDRPTVAKAVTVELSSEEALKILLATNVGKLSLILRQAAEPDSGPNARVTEHDLDPTQEGGADFLKNIKALQAAATPSTRVETAAAMPKEPTTKTVTVLRGLKGDNYEVPKSQ
jgi:pilus assembly protein CpaB